MYNIVITVRRLAASGIYGMLSNPSCSALSCSCRVNDILTRHSNDADFLVCSTCNKGLTLIASNPGHISSFNAYDLVVDDSELKLMPPTSMTTEVPQPLGDDHDDSSDVFDVVPDNELAKLVYQFILGNCDLQRVLNKSDETFTAFRNNPLVSKLRDVYHDVEMLWDWAFNNAAIHLVINKLNTESGGPSQTLSSIYKSYTNLRTQCLSSCRGLLGHVIGMDVVTVIKTRLFIRYINTVVRIFNCACSGSMTMSRPCSIASRTFFTANAKTITSWISLISPVVMELAWLSHDPSNVIKFGWNVLEQSVCTGI